MTKLFLPPSPSLPILALKGEKKNIKVFTHGKCVKMFHHNTLNTLAMPIGDIVIPIAKPTSWATTTCKTFFF
jgi:hypothetical protein